MYFFYFYPLGLDQTTRRRPVLSLAVMAVMAVSFLWSRFFPYSLPWDPYDLVFFPGYGSPWTVATAIFLHAGWLHLLGNLIYLYAFAPVLEDRLGPARFLLYFLILGVFGNLAHGVAAATGWLGTAGSGVLGASGAIAGLLAFALVRLPAARLQVAWWIFAPLMGQNRAGRSRVPVILAVGGWIVLQLVQGLVASETGSSVSFAAHLGGFAAGLLLALLLGQSREGQADAIRVRAERYFRDGQYPAAVGAWTEYLAIRPDDTAARLELARAQRLAGWLGDAGGTYRRVFEQCLEAGDVADALDVYAEVGRSRLRLTLSPQEMNSIAFYREKQLDHAGAVDVYCELYETFPSTHTGQRGLVRAIALLKRELGDEARAAELMARAARDLPEGSWRGYLERNFNLESGPGADAGAVRPDPVSVPRS